MKHIFHERFINNHSCQKELDVQIANAKEILDIHNNIYGGIEALLFFLFKINF